MTTTLHIDAKPTPDNIFHSAEYGPDGCIIAGFNNAFFPHLPLRIGELSADDLKWSVQIIEVSAGHGFVTINSRTRRVSIAVCKTWGFHVHEKDHAYVLWQLFGEMNKRVTKKITYEVVTELTSLE